MTREEAIECAKKMTYQDAIRNTIYAKGIRYKKATRIKLQELAEIADKLERDNDMTREEAIQVLKWFKNGVGLNDDLKRALDMAIEALNDWTEYSDKLWKNAYERGKAEALEWILCSEKLPSESGTYLTTTAKGAVCTDHYYANSVDIGGRHWSHHKHREPVAWMPLPEPYNRGAENETSSI